METIQMDLSDEALVISIRTNMTAFFHHLGNSFPDGYLKNDRFMRWHAPIPHPWFNGVLSSQMPQDEDRIFIEQTIQYFRSEDVAVCTWWLEPHLKCPDWEPVLSKFGFRFSNETPGMAADLRALHEPAQTVDGFEVREVIDEETLRTWVHVFTRGYGMPADWESSVYDLESRVGWEFPIRNFIGYWNGEPVATSTVFFGGGVAGIYNVSTLPKARGRGIGAALTLHSLHLAREVGYCIGILQSSEMGFNVYRKLGFRHLCQIEHFYLALA